LLLLVVEVEAEIAPTHRLQAPEEAVRFLIQDLDMAVQVQVAVLLAQMVASLVELQHLMDQAAAARDLVLAAAAAVNRVRVLAVTAVLALLVLAEMAAVLHLLAVAQRVELTAAAAAAAATTVAVAV
jgi:hypothetical protein